MVYSAKPFSRVMAFTVMTVAVLVFMLSLAGVIGVWIANGPVTNLVLDALRPLISTLLTVEKALGDANQGLTGITDVVGSLKGLLDSAGLLKDFLPGVVDSVARLSDSLNNLQATLGDSSGQLVDVRMTLETIESNISNWIDLATVILSVLFLWIAFSQASLFAHGWLYFTGKDLLRWRIQQTAHQEDAGLSASSAEIDAPLLPPTG